jgi:hypothetical protein
VPRESSAALSRQHRIRAVVAPVAPQRKPGIADLIDAGWTELSSLRSFFPDEPRSWPPGRGSSGRMRIFAPMTTAPSIAIAAVAALLVHSFGRVMRSPLRRWRRRRLGPNSPLTDFIELCIAHRIRVDDVDKFPQVSAATAETSPYFSGEFLNELGAANFHHILFASRIFSLGLFSNQDGANHDETRRP